MSHLLKRILKCCRWWWCPSVGGLSGPWVRRVSIIV